MAVPSSGQLQLSKIFQELDNDDYDGVGSPPDNLSLSGSSSGQYGAINTNNNASNRPTGTAPHQMSEFYSYDHDATSVWTATWGTIITNISGSKDLTPSNTIATIITIHMLVKNLITFPVMLVLHYYEMV